jgi:peptidoglycan/xylan/chitin deacetylase (PgdA/CDA1 family)
MGSVVISIDAELAWGFHDLDDPPRGRIDGARTAWHRVLSLLDRFEIPATWAVVGHLFLESCDGEHRSYPAPPGWFARDPGGDAQGQPNWFGRDLIEAIRDASTDHEIASHSFSHVVFGDPGTSRELADAELEASVAAAEEFGVPLRSFVFPRNRVGHREALADHGFECYRGPAPRRIDHTPLRPLAKLAGVTPPIVTPSVDEYGLVDVPPSLDLYGFEGLARSVAEPLIGDPIVRQARRGADAAAGSDGVFHLWLHPNNLTEEPDFERLSRVLACLDRRRGDLAFETMDEVATRVLDLR